MHKPEPMLLRGAVCAPVSTGFATSLFTMPHHAHWFFAAPVVSLLLVGCTHRPERSLKISPVAELPSEVAVAPTQVPAPVFPPALSTSLAPVPLGPTELGPASTKAAEGMEVRFVVTTQSSYADLFSRTLDNIVPDYVETKEVYRGQRASIVPLIRNYRLNADGCADVVLELETRRPDGTLEGEVLKVSLWEGPVVGLGLILYPKTNVNFWTEANDAPGPYTLIARVTDQVSKESREFTHTLVMRDYIPPPLPAGFSPALWYSTYYTNPTPELALPALTALYWSQPADRRQANTAPMLGFYDQVLLDNPWLLPIFSERLAKADTDEAYLLSLVLGFHLRGIQTAPGGIDEATWTRLAEFRAHDWELDAETVISESGQLDALWGRFFANGGYGPIRSLLGLLANYSDLGAGERWRQARAGGTNPVIAADIPPEVRREQLLRSTVWALRNNSRQHPLLQAYLNWTLRFGRMPLAQKMFLTRILSVETPAAGATVAAPAAAP